jgi:hypothetical protein
MYNVFFFLQDYMANIVIFLCLWHVKRTWEKQTCIKIKDPTLRNNVLQELGGCKWDNTSHTHLLFYCFCDCLWGNIPRIFLEKIFF